MINAVVGLGIVALFLLLAWIWDGVRDYLQVRSWHRSESVKLATQIRQQLPVRAGQLRSSVLLEPGERVIPFTPQRPRCAHQQAEPVVLSTGETVACVCISCLEALSAGHISSQRARAEATAYCGHDDLIDITSFGQRPGSDVICAGCGAMNP